MFAWAVRLTLAISVFWHTVAGCCAHHRHETSDRPIVDGSEPASAGCTDNACPGETAAHHRSSEDTAGGNRWEGATAVQRSPIGASHRGLQPCTEGSCSFADSPTVRVDRAKACPRAFGTSVAMMHNSLPGGTPGNLPAWEAGAAGRPSGPFAAPSLRTHLILCLLSL